MKYQQLTEVPRHDLKRRTNSFAEKSNMQYSPKKKSKNLKVYTLRVTIGLTENLNQNSQRK